MVVTRRGRAAIGAEPDRAGPLVSERAAGRKRRLARRCTRVTYNGGGRKKSEEELRRESLAEGGVRRHGGFRRDDSVATISKSRAARRDLMPSPRPWRQEEGPLATTINLLLERPRDCGGEEKT